MKILIANSNTTLNSIYDKEWNGCDYKIISSKEELNLELIRSWNPQYIFFPHWSFLIPETIYKNYTCIVFHMTDLPYGRGGSPLQNLIVRGHKTTKISALKVTKEIDAGDIYLKGDLELSGNAYEIYMKAGHIIIGMMDKIIKTNPQPEAQIGKITHFTRRKPSQSNIIGIGSINNLFDHIRMLDAPNYPKAFLETEKFRFEFSNAALLDYKTIEARVIIEQKDEK